MKNETSVMAILAAALGALCSYASALVVPLAVLIAVMLADYASGMAKAWSAGKLCSKTGLRGILKSWAIWCWWVWPAWWTGWCVTA